LQNGRAKGRVARFGGARRNSREKCNEVDNGQLSGGAAGKTLDKVKV
jgi:hypothetical protein